MKPIAETFRLCGITPSVAQSCFVKSVLGEALDTAELECWRACTGRTDYPQVPFQEADLHAGRKGGKTEIIAATLLIHRACNDTDGPGVYLLVAPSKSSQAKLGWNAIVRLITVAYPGMILEINESQNHNYLINGNVISIASANYRNLRGPRYKVVVIDEAAFYVSEDPADGGSHPLEFILDSCVGGMITTDQPLLLLQSTPWVKAGILYEHFRDRDANPERLVFKAPTLLMNPAANVRLMEKHRKERGESFYAREYLAEFSEDSVAFIDPDDIDACVSPSSMPFFPPRENAHYVMALDPARKRDHFGYAIAHRENDVIVVDRCGEFKPGVFGFKYSSILPQLFDLAREYGVRTIASDQIDFGGIEATIPSVNGTPEFELTRVMTGGQSGAELCDVTRALFAQRKLVLPFQTGLADEFKRLGDFLTVGGGRDVRAKRGHDDRSRAVMLSVYQAFIEPLSRAPILCVIPYFDPPTEGDARRTEEDLRSRFREEHFFSRGRRGLGSFR